MSLPSFQITVTSCVTGDTVKVFDPQSFYDMRYSRKLNGIGFIALALPSTAELYNLFDLDNFIEVFRTSPITGELILEETYLTRSRRRFRESNQERLVVGGVSLNHLLTRRIIDPADDPAAVAGYSNKSGAADLVMRAYVREQAGDLASADRQIPGLTVNTVSSVGFPVDISARFVNLMTIVDRIAREGGVDFQISRASGAALEMDIERIGSNKSQSSNYPFNPWVGVNPERGNLADPSLKIDRTDEQNYVYALGQGQGENRQLHEASENTIYLSPFNRVEFVKDARNVAQTNTAGLQSAALAALADNRIVSEFSFNPTGVDAGSVYRRNWDLGDIITASWGDYSQDLRITRVEINLQDRDEEITVTVGDEYDENNS